MNKQPIAFKEQKCTVLGLALGWLGYVAGIFYFAYERSWVGGALFVVLVPCLRWALFHFFPSISRFLGYGRVDDKIPESTDVTRVAVTFYSFFSCPFCPIVLRRLEALQQVMDFKLETIDLTLKPQMVVSKAIRSVPVVEVGGKRLVGNLTTAQLAEFISLPPASMTAA
jgi:glutaredoxin